MLRFLFGLVCGIYISQNYNIPNLYNNFKKLEEEFKKKRD